MYTFTNRFSGSGLRHRIGMMNRRRSGPVAWSRYVLWLSLLGIMALACQHSNQPNELLTSHAPNPNALPATTPNRALVVTLEDKGTWYRHLALFNTRFGTETVQSDPVILQLSGNQFRVADDHVYESTLYINGKEAPLERLNQIAPEFVRELFVMHQWDNLAESEPNAKPYQIFVETQSAPIPFNTERKQFFTLFQAAALSAHPRGESYSFTMNQLLEATFFHNKNALVERTKNEHLAVYDEFKKTTAIFINELPATPADVATIHVREVARVHTKERPYTDWFRADEPLPRFELHILTTPKRAIRDSTYYVFSPFYTGDF